MTRPHINTLIDRHRALNAMIDQQGADPRADLQQLLRMKRQRLRLKDQIATILSCHSEGQTERYLK